jgi:hypothetical protein
MRSTRWGLFYTKGKNMQRDPITEAHWTLVGTSDDTDSTYTICGLTRDEVDEHIAELVDGGWDVHVYEPVLKQIIPGEH